MKWKHQFTFVVLIVCLLAACRSNKDAIQFSDEQVRPGDRSVKAVIAPPKPLDKQDLLKVELTVYGYLLQRHFWDDKEYSAVFLQGEPDEIGAAIKKFPNHIPPLKTNDRAELKPNRTPIDRDTGKPAMVLSVDALDPVDDMVAAIGRWYAGAAVTGFYTFTLRKVGDDWTIENVK